MKYVITKIETKDVELKDLKVGDTIPYQVSLGSHHYSMFFGVPFKYEKPVKIKRITPKRTKIILENDKELNVNGYPEEYLMRIVDFEKLHLNDVNIKKANYLRYIHNHLKLLNDNNQIDENKLFELANMNNETLKEIYSKILSLKQLVKLEEKKV